MLTGVIFTLLMLAGIYFQGWVMLALLAFAMLASTHEMYSAFANTAVKPVRWTGFLFCALTIASHAVSMQMKTDIHAQMAVPVLLVCMVLTASHLVFAGKVAVERLVASVFPLLYPGIFYMVLMDLLLLKNSAVVTTALILAFFSASINDVFALFSGMLFGKHKLAPELSPKKTIEGSIGGMIFCVAFSMAVPALLRLLAPAGSEFSAQLSALPPLWSFGILGFVAGALSQIGDLTASMVKRHCGVKDYGKLLPGHGGIMDRLDGVLFCGAACHVFFKIAGLG